MPKWVWLGRFQTRSSLFIQYRAILLACRLLQYCDRAPSNEAMQCRTSKSRLQLICLLVVVRPGNKPALISHFRHIVIHSNIVYVLQHVILLSTILKFAVDIPLVLGLAYCELPLTSVSGNIIVQYTGMPTYCGFYRVSGSCLSGSTQI